MTKRLIAFAAAAALLVGGAVAAIPGGSAFAQPSSRQCDRLLTAADAASNQLSQIPSNSQSFNVLVLRIEQLNKALSAADCGIQIIIPK